MLPPTFVVISTELRAPALKSLKYLTCLRKTLPSRAESVFSAALYNVWTDHCRAHDDIIMSGCPEKTHMIPWLEPDTPFPQVSQALTEAEGLPGLLAAGADLTPARLLLAYRHGIFPWYSDDQPILWWSPDPRMVLPTAEFIISASLKKKVRQVAHSMESGGRWQIRFDHAFEQVMRACAAPRDQAGTWITDEIVAGYVELHQEGYAHSCELWESDTLVAGAYGVGIGRMFYGESMFTRISDGSKIALAYLVHFLKSQGVTLIDCQQETAHLASLGARPIGRSSFLEHVARASALPAIRNWQPLNPLLV